MERLRSQSKIINNVRDIPYNRDTCCTASHSDSDKENSLSENLDLAGGGSTDSVSRDENLTNFYEPHHVASHSPDLSYSSEDVKTVDQISEIWSDQCDGMCGLFDEVCEQCENNYSHDSYTGQGHISQGLTSTESNRLCSSI